MEKGPSQKVRSVDLFYRCGKGEVFKSADKGVCEFSWFDCMLHVGERVL